MPDQPPARPIGNEGGPRPKVRDDDARGAPKGSFGNKPFVPTDEQRAKARTLAKTFPPHAEHYIAALLGISRTTLQRHFEGDMLLGRAEMLAQIGGQMIHRAINADAVGEDTKPIAKGDLDAQKFVLARLGGWSTKLVVSDKEQGPAEFANMTEAEIDARLEELAAQYGESDEAEAESEGDA